MCSICGKNSVSHLCEYHDKIYSYDEENGWYRRKRRVRSKLKKWKNQEKLRLVLERIYGKSKVQSSVHPEWALSNKGVLLEYDFAIPSRKLLIEYNGVQHYSFPNFYHKSRRDFLEQKERDSMKYIYAKQNSYSLLSIPYYYEINDTSINTLVFAFLGQ